MGVLTLQRLQQFAHQVPTSVPGTFSFPFGQIHYFDVQALVGQYYDIFIEKVYEVKGVSDAPYIIDCGGHVGMSVIWFKQRYPEARITVFEADQTIADILEKNLHNFALSSIDIRRVAVSNVNSSVQFAPNGSDGGRITSGGSINVPSIRLSDLIHEQVDILKLDIEGSEFDLLIDLCRTEKIQLVQNIVCELHGRHEVSRQMGEMWTRLVDAGFYLTINRGVSMNLPGSDELTPFSFAKTAKFQMMLYAWKP